QPAYDRLKLRGQPPVFGLYSNVAEWTSSWGAYPGLTEPQPRSRVVRGAPQSAAQGKSEVTDVVRGPRERFNLNLLDSYPRLGFRCARSAQPRRTTRDFGAILGR